MAISEKPAEGSLPASQPGLPNIQSGPLLCMFKRSQCVSLGRALAWRALFGSQGYYRHRGRREARPGRVPGKPAHGGASLAGNRDMLCDVHAQWMRLVNTSGEYTRAALLSVDEWICSPTAQDVISPVLEFVAGKPSRTCETRSGLSCQHPNRRPSEKCSAFGLLQH